MRRTPTWKSAEFVEVDAARRGDYTGWTPILVRTEMGRFWALTPIFVLTFPTKICFSSDPNWVQKGRRERTPIRWVQSWTSKVNQSLKVEYIGKEWIIWQFYYRFLVGFSKYVEKHTSEVFPTSGLGWPKFRPKISKLLTTTKGQICVNSHLQETFVWNESWHTPLHAFMN